MFLYLYFIANLPCVETQFCLSREYQIPDHQIKIYMNQRETTKPKELNRQENTG